MKFRFSYLVFVFIILLVFSCNFSGKKEPLNQNQDVTKNSSSIIDSFSWLLGDWQDINPEFVYYESWKQDKDGNLKGKGYMIADNDTLFEEFLCISKSSEGKIFYIVSFAEDLVTAGSVNFELVKSENRTYYFHNATNDYPQYIVYQNISKDSIKAYISGKDKFGREQKDEFFLIRIKEI
ncbi:MAG: DUF6265 family protein [Bacteroidales bacterium]|jgi:hypothetical protein|nr:DUF6265 family protein [Bacteroidales bacterium]HOL98016.1 DUF6265 family protein [Bacteroidales bacterium]HOM36555.1 DUF6265 family protein [Bacteroidales bacterium]HPD23704.1 DUF6265 family protein [Bacteroidales bacterium]HRS99819.1 DUF6265 family protein [Bacteroidales bacterium]